MASGSPHTATIDLPAAIATTLRLLTSFVRTSFRNSAIYRFDFWINNLSIFIMMYAMNSLWSILYQQSPEAFGLTRDQMCTYGVLGILLLPIIGTPGAIRLYIAQQVRMGTLELDLLKPLDFILHLCLRNLGRLAVELIARGLPGLLFAFLVLQIEQPASRLAGFGFAGSLLLGYFVFLGFDLLVGMLAIVTLDIRSYGWAINSLIRFASGQFVPLWMFPVPLATIAWALPFWTGYHAPMSIYIGADQQPILQILLLQGAWMIGLFVAARLVWRRLHRRLVIQGG